MLSTILVGGSMIYTWMWWSNFQAKCGITIFTTLGDFVIFKLILVLCTFMLVAPISLVVNIIKAIIGKSRA